MNTAPALVLISSVLAACSAQQPSVTPSSPPARVDFSEEPAPSSSARTGASSSSAASSSAASSSAADAEHGEQSGLYLAPETNEHASQSPINIVTSRTVPGRHEIKFHYQSTREHVDNLGHTVKVTYDPGSSLDYDGQSYDLVQFHFHTPSEHLLDGVTYPMEMHLVHAERGRPEHLLVIGVLFKEGDGNELIEKLIADVPERAGGHRDRDVRLDASSVLGPGEGYYHYEGSLTTPPYSESVTWLVLDQVHDASAEQIEALNRIEGNNARHIQAQRARLIDHWR